MAKMAKIKFLSPIEAKDGTYKTITGKLIDENNKVVSEAYSTKETYDEQVGQLVDEINELHSALMGDETPAVYVVPQTVTTITGGYYGYKIADGAEEEVIIDAPTYLGNTYSQEDGTTIPDSATTVIVHKDIELCDGTSYRLDGVHAVSRDISENATEEYPDGTMTYGGFADCGVQKVIFSKNSTFTKIGDETFVNCRMLSEVNIPSSVKGIGSLAFGGCETLRDITFPNGLLGIAAGAFYYCSSLTHIKLPKTMNSIGSCAFAGCNNLTEITLPFLGFTKKFSDLSTTTHFEYIFGNAPASLKKVNITVGNIHVTTEDGTVDPKETCCIPAKAFYNCSGLTEITIPSGVTTIEANAFYGCSGLTEITIPSTVTTIEANAFYGCTNLKTVINNSALDIEFLSTNNGYLGYYATTINNRDKSHTRATTYSYDGTSHWYSCTDPGCTATFCENTHEMFSGRCEQCGYDNTSIICVNCGSALEGGECTNRYCERSSGYFTCDLCGQSAYKSYGSTRLYCPNENCDNYFNKDNYITCAACNYSECQYSSLEDFLEGKYSCYQCGYHTDWNNDGDWYTCSVCGREHNSCCGATDMHQSEQGGSEYYCDGCGSHIAGT